MTMTSITLSEMVSSNDSRISLAAADLSETDLYSLIAGNLMVTSLACATIYFASLSLYRLYFHPLRNFPGPRLAAISGLYEFYFDVIKNGSFVKHIALLHHVYGPTVRIKPNHLHISDPDFYREVNNLKGNYLKAPEFYENLGMRDSLPTIMDPVKHKMHRAMVNPLFSPQSVSKMEHSVNLLVHKFAQLVERRYAEGRYAEISTMARSFTIDVIAATLFGLPMGLLDAKEDKPPILTDIDMFLERIMFVKHFPFLIPLAVNMPLWIARIAAPGYSLFRKTSAELIETIKARLAKGMYENDEGNDTVFDLWLKAVPEKGYVVPDTNCLVDNGFFLLIGGSDTTAMTISWTLYLIYTEPGVLQTLRDSLRDVPRDSGGTYSYKDISSLPYLAGVIKESLRRRCINPGPLPRIVPKEGAMLGDRFIPGGTVISLSSYILNSNLDIFPEPKKFIPERWMGQKGKELERYNTSFSKGPRACIGIKLIIPTKINNLAYLQIYLVVVTFVTRFDMEVFETTWNGTDWRDHAVLTCDKPVKMLVRPIRSMG